MALKVKAVERKIKFNKNDEGVYRYMMQPELYIALTQAKVIKEAALRSGCSHGVMKACWDAAGEVIRRGQRKVTLWPSKVWERCASDSVPRVWRTSTT